MDPFGKQYLPCRAFPRRWRGLAGLPVAGNGRAGLEQVAARKPDCILTDLLMPELGGLELLETLREQGTAIPVIIITANIQESVRRRCLELGAAAVVNKPVRQEELLSALRKALGDDTE